MIVDPPMDTSSYLHKILDGTRFPGIYGYKINESNWLNGQKEDVCMELYKTFRRVPIMKSVQVYEQMKEKLKNGQWGFGEKISVNDLIEEFKVSRRPVMDAMKMLENDGFIEIIPQSGCKVVDYSKKKRYRPTFNKFCP